MEPTLIEIRARASRPDRADRAGRLVGPAALSAAGACVESGRGAPPLPQAPTAFARLSAAAVRGGRPSQPDNSRHLGRRAQGLLTVCFSREIYPGTTFAPTRPGAAFFEAASWNCEQLPRCSLRLCAVTRLPPRAAHIFFP